MVLHALSVQIIVKLVQPQLVQNVLMDTILKISYANNVNLNVRLALVKQIVQNVHSVTIWTQHSNANNVAQIVNLALLQVVVNVLIVLSL